LLQIPREYNTHMAHGQSRAFGQIALDKGFIVESDLSKALEMQAAFRAIGRYPMIGMLLLKNGAINSSQLIEVLIELEKQSKAVERKENQE
jgi:hypothetical protein